MKGTCPTKGCGQPLVIEVQPADPENPLDEGIWACANGHPIAVYLQLVGPNRKEGYDSSK